MPWAVLSRAPAPLIGYGTLLAIGIFAGAATTVGHLLGGPSHRAGGDLVAPPGNGDRNRRQELPELTVPFHWFHTKDFKP